MHENKHSKYIEFHLKMILSTPYQDWIHPKKSLTFVIIISGSRPNFSHIEDIDAKFFKIGYKRIYFFQNNFRQFHFQGISDEIAVISLAEAGQ